VLDPDRRSASTICVPDPERRSASTVCVLDPERGPRRGSALAIVTCLDDMSRNVRAGDNLAGGHR
jgi:hypothetical protein